MGSMLVFGGEYMSAMSTHALKPLQRQAQSEVTEEAKAPVPVLLEALGTCAQCLFE